MARDRAIFNEMQRRGGPPGRMSGRGGRMGPRGSGRMGPPGPMGMGPTGPMGMDPAGPMGPGGPMRGRSGPSPQLQQQMIMR
jgi:hypothetical protein